MDTLVIVGRFILGVLLILAAVWYVRRHWSEWTKKSPKSPDEKQDK